MPITSLTLSLQDFYPENYTSYVSYHLFHCYLKLGVKSCKFDTLNLGNDVTVYNLQSFEFKVYMVVKQDIPMNGTHLKIIYNKRAADFYYIILFIIAWIMTFIVICVALYASVSACQKFVVRLRRFRLLRQLRRGLHEELPDEDAQLSLEVPAVNWKNMVRNVRYSGKENEFEQTECCFCLDHFQEDETVAKLFCKHIFHPKCFENWITLPDQSQVKCPICARVIV